MKYNKITEQDVLKKICKVVYWNFTHDICRPCDITWSLKTSRYQVNKHIKSLKEKGLIEYKSAPCYDEYDTYPPINGWTLTEKGKKTNEYQKIDVY